MLVAEEMNKEGDKLEWLPRVVFDEPKRFEHWVAWIDAREYGMLPKKLFERGEQEIRAHKKWPPRDVTNAHHARIRKAYEAKRESVVDLELSGIWKVLVSVGVTGVVDFLGRRFGFMLNFIPQAIKDHVF